MLFSVVGVITFLINDISRVSCMQNTLNFGHAKIVIPRMEFQLIVELLHEILRRMNDIELNTSSVFLADSLKNYRRGGNGQDGSPSLGGWTSPHRILVNRHDSLERYRVAYNRQHGFPDDMIHPTNPDGED